MAKAASSGDAAEEEKKFGDMLKLLRKKKPVNMAVRIGGEKKVVMETDKRKKPKALRKIAKDNGGGPKFVSGKISLQGKVITIETIETEFPGSLPKQLKNYFRDMKQAFRIEIVPGSADESGVADDDDDDDEDGAASAEIAGAQAAESTETGDTESPEAVDSEGPGPSAGGVADAARAKMMKAFKAMNQPLKGALATAEPQLRNRLGTLAKTFGAEVKGEDMRKAAAVLQLLKKTLDAAQPGGSPNGPEMPGAAPAGAAEAEAAPAPDPAVEERRTGRLSQISELRATVAALRAGLADQGGG